MAARRHPSSFRDPSGFLYEEGGTLRRQVCTPYAPHYDRLMASGLYSALQERGWLVPHREVDRPAPEPETAYRVLEPDRVPFVSYPYEWSFGQYRRAALLTLDIQRLALEHGMTLKDASAYNIQFLGSRPVLIDSLSFAIYEEGGPWVAYRQFCQHFLAPLALMSYRDARLGQMMRTEIDGPALDLACRLLPWKARLRFPLLAHLFLHAKSQKSRARSRTPRTAYRVSPLALRGLDREPAKGGLQAALEPAGDRMGRLLRGNQLHRGLPRAQGGAGRRFPREDRAGLGLGPGREYRPLQPHRERPRRAHGGIRRRPRGGRAELPAGGEGPRRASTAAAPRPGQSEPGPGLGP